MLPLFITFPRRCSVPPAPSRPPHLLLLPPSSFWHCFPRCPLLVLVTLRPCLSTRFLFLPLLSPITPLWGACLPRRHWNLSSSPFVPPFPLVFLVALTHSFALLFPYCLSLPVFFPSVTSLVHTSFHPLSSLRHCFIFVYPPTLPGLHHLFSVTLSFSQSFLYCFISPPSLHPTFLRLSPCFSMSLSLHPSSHFPLTFQTFSSFVCLTSLFTPFLSSFSSFNLAFVSLITSLFLPTHCLCTSPCFSFSIQYLSLYLSSSPFFFHRILAASFSTHPFILYSASSSCPLASLISFLSLLIPPVLLYFLPPSFLIFFPSSSVSYVPLVSLYLFFLFLFFHFLSLSSCPPFFIRCHFPPYFIVHAFPFYTFSYALSVLTPSLALPPISVLDWGFKMSNKIIRLLWLRLLCRPPSGFLHF